MKVRSFNFDFSEQDVLNYARTKELTRIINSVSLLFPVGERHFCEAVRHYRETIKDQKLLDGIKVFIQQESNHSRSHRELNNRLKEVTGVNVEKLEEQALKRLLKHSKTPEDKLLTTVALERYTGLFGWLLPYVDSIALKDNVPSDLMRLHAKEEKEHVHIAEDVMKYCAPASYYKQAKFMFLAGKNLIEQTVINYKAIKRAELQMEAKG